MRFVAIAFLLMIPLLAGCTQNDESEPQEPGLDDAKLGPRLDPATDESATSAPVSNTTTTATWTAYECEVHIEYSAAITSRQDQDCAFDEEFGLTDLGVYEVLEATISWPALPPTVTRVHSQIMIDDCEGQTPFTAACPVASQWEAADADHLTLIVDTTNLVKHRQATWTISFGVEGVAQDVTGNVSIRLLTTTPS